MYRGLGGFTVGFCVGVLQMGSAENKADVESDEEEIPFTSSSPAGGRKVHSLDFEMAAHMHMHSRVDVVNSWIYKLMRIRPLGSIYIVLIRAKINILLPFGPLAILLHYISGKHVRFLVCYTRPILMSLFVVELHSFSEVKTRRM